jgi:diguanylate cyclase (GGDEF)-like protein
VDIPLGQGVSGWVAQNSKPILNGNPALEPGYVDAGSGFGLGSALSVPFSGCSDQFVGAITLYHTQTDAYQKDHLRILLAVNDKVSRAIESASKFEQARREASTDELTSLPNARSLLLRLQDEIVRAESQDQRLAIMVCDLDGFKHVNDSFGHLTGNELLKRVARIMEQNCRETDYVGRMGGDEFVVMLRGIRREELELKIENMNRMVRNASADLCGGNTDVGISVGLAFFPEHGSDVETLLSRADKEMYAAKGQRKAARARVVPLRRGGGYASIA